ncbi:MAG: F0F1 ATP synthase subunit B [Treponema sp.]|nr:F0F1 ATP synthase subunit B [Treponema sp.]
MENSGLLNPNLVTFLGTIINITVLYFLLKAILFKPVSKFMEARAKKIEGDISQAEKDKNQAKQLLEQYEAQLKNAEAEADEIIRQARETGNAEADRIIAEGKQAIELMQASARKRIETEQQTAIEKFKVEAVVLVMAVSSRLIGRNLQTDDNRRYANMLMDELAAQQIDLPGAAQKGNVR